MMSAQQYIAQAKAKLGNPAMSDRELGERLGGFSQTFLSQAKRGKMTDPLAMRIAAACGVPAGEVLMVARLEREKDPAVRAALVEWAGKISGLLSLEQGAAQSSGLVADQKPKSPLEVHQAGHVGGEGGIRTHGTLRYA
jgi:hypothetical protein